MNVLIINGPNLNLLGKREPDIYGNVSFDKYIEEKKGEFNFNIDCYQSNVEGEIINTIHNAINYNYVIINAGAYSHTSIAIADAIRATNLKVIEVHISNVFKRENFRKHSFISEVSEGIICGFGLDSYYLALRRISDIFNG